MNYNLGIDQDVERGLVSRRARADAASGYFETKPEVVIGVMASRQRRKKTVVT